MSSWKGSIAGRGIPDEEKRNAVDHYSGHGKSLARTIGAMGYPSRKVLSSWVDERTLVICAVCEKE